MSKPTNQIEPIDYNLFISINSEKNAMDAIRMSGLPVFLQSIGFILIGAMSMVSISTPALLFVGFGIFLLIASLLIRRGNTAIVLPLAFVNLFVTGIVVYAALFVFGNLREMIAMAMCIVASIYSFNALRGLQWLKNNKAG